MTWWENQRRTGGDVTVSFGPTRLGTKTCLTVAVIFRWRGLYRMVGF